MNKKVFSLFLCVTMILGIGTRFCLTFASAETQGAFEIIGTDGGYNYASSVLTINSAGTYTIANTDPNVAATDTIVVSAASGTVNITLSGINIDVSGTENAVAFLITGECTTDITLEPGKTNILKSGSSKAGLQNGVHPLVIGGEGTLSVTGGNFGAGIGGSDGQAASNITINSGTVIAKAGTASAGIGSGANQPGTNITINGGGGRLMQLVDYLALGLVEEPTVKAIVLRLMTER